MNYTLVTRRGCAKCAVAKRLLDAHEVEYLELVHPDDPMAEIVIKDEGIEHVPALVIYDSKRTLVITSVLEMRKIIRALVLGVPLRIYIP